MKRDGWMGFDENFMVSQWYWDYRILLGLNGDISWEPSHFDDVVFWSMLQPNLLQLCFTIHQHCNPDLDHSRENPEGVPTSFSLGGQQPHINQKPRDVQNGLEDGFSHVGHSEIWIFLILPCKFLVAGLKSCNALYYHYISEQLITTSLRGHKNDE